MSKTVLIVGENTTEHTIAHALIRARGIAVRAAADGTQAWELLVRDCRDVALLIIDLDHGGAGMNGWELLRCVRGRFGGLPLAHQPQIAVMLRPTRPEAASFARRLGADTVLHKPLSPGVLVAAVERAVVTAATDAPVSARPYRRGARTRTALLPRATGVRRSSGPPRGRTTAVVPRGGLHS